MKHVVNLIPSDKYELLPRSLKKRIASLIPIGIRRKWYFCKEIKDTDIFLIGHPKSGNTWLACMLGVLARPDARDRINISNIGEFVPTIHDNDIAIIQYANLPKPRIFRNEAPHYPEAYPKTIYIIRDPRAALLSYYHHCLHDSGRTDWDIVDFIDEMLFVGCIKSLEPQLVRWDIQVEMWLKLQEQQNVIVVKYEDLKQDCRSCLRKIDKFLGLNSSDEAIEFAIEKNTFDNMKKDEQLFGSESFPGEKGERGFFVRKGKVDAWKEEVPADTVKKIEKAYGQLMRKLGYL